MLREPPVPTASWSSCRPTGSEQTPSPGSGRVRHVLLLKTRVVSRQERWGRWKESTVLSGVPLHNSHLATNHTEGSRPAVPGWGGVGGKDEAGPLLHPLGRAVIEQCTPASMLRQVHEMCPSHWPQGTHQGLPTHA